MNLLEPITIGKMKTRPLYPMLQALLAAALFGASAPLSKVLLGDIQPIPLAALLYLGSGAVAVLLRLGMSFSRPAAEQEAHLRPPDVPWLAGAVLAGGVIGPILLLVSLEKTPASTASLLLNFESVATALIAGLIFREAIGRRVWLGIAFITLASFALSFSGGAWGISLGALGILGACFFWGLDNNLTRSISAKDPLTIVAIKGLGAGTFSLLLSLALGKAFPAGPAVLWALLVGAVCYGISIMLFVLALRSLGAARTGALFATAPFVGTGLSFVVFHEALTLQLIISLPLMILGGVLLLGEHHEHAHWHDAQEHEHLHSHSDLHHAHQHPAGMEVPDGQHSHLHQHEPLSHSHPHAPDVHHRHDHI